MPYVAKEDLYLTADRTKIVRPAKDGTVPAEANFLLAREGAVVDDAAVKRYDIDADEAPDRAALLGETGYSHTLEEEQELLKDAEARGAHGEAAHRRQILANMEAGEKARSDAKRAGTSPSAKSAAKGEPEPAAKSAAKS